MAAIVLHNQSLLDIALQATGDAANAIQMAFVNGISITDALEPGTGITKTESPDNTDIKNYYAAKSIQPATVNYNEKINYPEGIDFWEIEGNFVIS
ncbi:hypothetical protein [Elizabethkingia occulta]|uniref:hypothetical protein n=1 Tax=Elizabethkingia occulta TaxID=1867263 RepID=UPI00099AEA1D|nr:hypothetical protein [Elizabethkingia occulta]OPB87802.1 hypothetical protein BB020_04270 [Elizabethkingia occulta]